MNATIGRVLREALWAPAAIVVLNVIVAGLPQADGLWSLLHFLGGAAVAFFYYKVARIAVPMVAAWRYLFAFALACATALAWEIVEFIVDQFAGTTLQQGNFDTMSDLILGMAGAAVYLVIHALAISRDRPSA